jgi:hypothetical protein
LTGVLLLMVGNGCRVRFWASAARWRLLDLELSVVMSAYFLGFLLGSRLAPSMIRRVGHVRVFAALGSLISAVLVLYPMLVDWQVWAADAGGDRLCFRRHLHHRRKLAEQHRHERDARPGAVGLHDRADAGHRRQPGAARRGRSLRLHLFLIPSVLVSLAFLPILLLATAGAHLRQRGAPGFAELFRISPAGLRGDFHADFGRGLLGDVRHGLGLGGVGLLSVGRSRCSPLSSMSAGWCCNIRSAGCPTGWTGARSCWAVGLVGVLVLAVAVFRPALRGASGGGGHPGRDRPIRCIRC